MGTERPTMDTISNDYHEGNDVVRTFVPPTKMPPRAPLGPSLVFIAGIRFSGMDFVLQKSAAVRRETCSLFSSLTPACPSHIPSLRWLEKLTSSSQLNDYPQR